MSRRRRRLPESAADRFFGGGKRSKNPRKDAQLCAQVAEALRLALAGAHDAALQDLWLLEVEPAPHVGHLRVLLEVGEETGVDAAREALDARGGWLRAQVGEAIHRKKVPSLSYVLLPTAVAGREDER